jgi:hypothetical protein
MRKPRGHLAARDVQVLLDLANSVLPGEQSAARPIVRLGVERLDDATAFVLANLSGDPSDRPGVQSMTGRPLAGPGLAHRGARARLAYVDAGEASDGLCAASSATPHSF